MRRFSVLLAAGLASLSLFAGVASAATPDVCTLPYKPHWCES